jgi:hypothetical protein
MLDVRLTKHILYAIDQAQDAIGDGFHGAPDHVIKPLEDAIGILLVALERTVKDAK